MKNAIAKINASELEKIVLSRKVIIKINTKELNRLLKRLFYMYPSAYRYVWYHPEHGLWCGASPELLLKADRNNIKTVSLAGTKPRATNVAWTTKEIEEQEIVTRSIKTSLNEVTKQLSISEAKTHYAGSLAHLRTEIKGKLKNGFTSLDICKKLHPTPAVCGTPSKKALDYIIANEGYDREFYTGFMGMICKENKAAFYVNLRCMKIENTTATIYTGGGIIGTSNPKSERIETQRKLQTMLQVIAPFL